MGTDESVVGPKIGPWGTGRVNSSGKDIGFCKITEAQVKNAIKSMKSTTFVGPDGIPLYVIKRCVDIFKVPLTCIFNLSITTGEFPTQLKVTIIGMSYF